MSKKSRKQADRQKRQGLTTEQRKQYLAQVREDMDRAVRYALEPDQ